MDRYYMPKCPVSNCHPPLSLCIHSLKHECLTLTLPYSLQTRSSHLRQGRRKIRATIAKIRATTEKQNARSTSREILLLESRVQRNNHSHMPCSNTHIIHLTEWAKWNMVYLSTLVHGQRLRIWYSYGILHGWVKIACLSNIVVVEYYIAEQQQSVQQSHRAGGLSSNLVVLYFIVVDLQVHTALQIWAWHKVL